MKRRRLEVIIREGIPVVAAAIAVVLLLPTALPKWASAVAGLVVFGVFSWALGETKDEALKKDRAAKMMDLIETILKLSLQLRDLNLQGEARESLNKICALVDRICITLRIDPARYGLQMYEDLKYSVGETFAVMQMYAKGVSVEGLKPFLTRVEQILSDLDRDISAYRAIEAESRTQVLLDVFKENGIRPNPRP